MQQPCTNSEGVRRCMTIPDIPRSSQLCYQPRAQNRANRDKQFRRPCSPAHTIPHFCMAFKEAWHSPYSRQDCCNLQLCSPNSSKCYAHNDIGKVNEKMLNDSFDYLRRPNNGHSASILPYNSMLDCHLNEYFKRKFGLLQMAELKRQRILKQYIRPCNSNKAKLKSKKRPLLSNGNSILGADVLYKVAVTTGNVKNAGSLAKVFLKMKGVRGDVPRTRLVKNARSFKSNKGTFFRFTKGSTHVFRIHGQNIGAIQSIVMETSGVKKEDAWYLQEIEIVNTETKQSYFFTCNQWFSLYHGDGQLHREFFALKSSNTEYEIVTVTGDIFGGGTDANIFLTLFGKTGATTKLCLKNNSRSICDRGSSDVFLLKARCVGVMKKVRIEHDNTGIGPGWYLERVVVTDLLNPQWKYYFPCGQWLAKDEGDGAICRELIGSKDQFSLAKASKYKVTVFTGDKKGAGTDANVYITLFGEFGDSGERPLKSSKNNFERGMTDEFFMDCLKLGRLERLRIGHDNSGFGPGWFLDKVIIDDMNMGTVFQFPCNRWFALDEDDGRISRELILGIGPQDASPGIPYIITISTGDVRNAGTNSNVYVVLHGGVGNAETSGKIWLESGKFQRGITDIFNVDVSTMLSPLSHIEVGHDNTGVGPGWFLDSVTVYCPPTGIEQFFACTKWLATDEGDGLIKRLLFEKTGLRKSKEKRIPWQAWIYTSDIKSAGTDANVFMVVYGDKGKSYDIRLEKKGDSFGHGAMDCFKFHTVDVGCPYKIRVWHDNTGMFSGWHLDKVEMHSLGSGIRYSFPCGRWLATDEDDMEIIRELPATASNIKKPLPVVIYKVNVSTGKQFTAGTDANVFVNIFGDLGDTGKRLLHHSLTSRNKFERGSVDEFRVEAVTLMKLHRIVVGHDGHGAGSGWFLDKIVVSQLGTEKYDAVFECNRWLAKDEDDGKIERELVVGGASMLSTTTYVVHVKTGDVRNAGTNANVFLKILGTKAVTESLKLQSSVGGGSTFERGRTGIFRLDTCDVGEVKRLQIGHDGTKPGCGWFLDHVSIEVPSYGKQFFFACHRWLAIDEGDGLTEIDMAPSSIKAGEKRIPYEVTVWTSDVKGAGTDAKVFLQMYGENSKTDLIYLRKKADNFKKAAVDKFKVEEVDVGKLQKIHIGHDGTGLFSGWHLEKILIQRHPLRKRLKKKPSEAEHRKSILNTVDLFDGEDESDSSSPSTPRRSLSLHSKYRESMLLDAVIEEDEDDICEDYWFYVNQWFARGDGGGEVVRELIPTNVRGLSMQPRLGEVQYSVHVFTGDMFGAGTDASVFITLCGEKSDSGERKLNESNHRNKFKRKQEDIFLVKAIDLGKLLKVKIRHDNQGIGSAWFLDWIEVNDEKMCKNNFFPCQRWLSTGHDDGQIFRELLPADASLKPMVSSTKSSTAIRDKIGLETKAAMTTYQVKVLTGDVWGAGTDANVFIILYGKLDNTGKLFLKSSLSNKNKFERNQLDEFTLETVNIGELMKIRIGHDNIGGGAAWYLSTVTIDCPSLGSTWEFPCNRWLSDKDDDGLIERELFSQQLETVTYRPCIPYEIATYTSDKSGASTDADVYVVLYGKEDVTRKTSLCSNKRQRKDFFRKGSTDRFIIELEDVGDTIEKLRIGHDGSGLRPGWHLDHVTVRRLQNTGKGSITYSFPCEHWLARSEEDGAIERELLPDKITKEVVGSHGNVKRQNMQIQDKPISKKYSVDIYTADVKGAGTDASVFMTMFGEKGDTGERKLHQSETNKDKFERGKVDRFTIEAVDIGSIYKLRIRHDNSFLNPAWYLDRVEVTDPYISGKYLFHCERWLGKNKEDGKIERSLYVKGYDGEISSSGTFRSTRFGSISSLDSPRDFLSKSPRLALKQFQHSMESDLGYPCIPYTVKVSTGNSDNSGTSSNVWIKIFGPRQKSTNRLYLHLVDKEAFLPGSVEVFHLEGAELDEIKNVEVGHDGTAPGTGWFLKSVEVEMPTKGKRYMFDCQQWLSRDQSDGKTTRLFCVDDGTSSVVCYRPLVPYEVVMTTGDVREAGTDARIFITLYGSLGATIPVEMAKKGERFERACTDVIKMEFEDVAPLKKLRVTVDPKGCNRKSWYLEKIELRNMNTGVLSVFRHDGWLGQGQDGDQLSVDIAAVEHGMKALCKSSYKVTVKTSGVKGAGTDANVSIILFGSNGDSGNLQLKKSQSNNRPFQKDQLDVFIFTDILSLGQLNKLRVSHDNKGLGSSWHLAYIEVEDVSTHRVFTFPCDRWLSLSEDDKQIVRELSCGMCAEPSSNDAREMVDYEVEVVTADKKQGGTIHNGWLILQGKCNTSKVFVLHNTVQNKILRSCGSIFHHMKPNLQSKLFDMLRKKGQTSNFVFTSSALGKLQCCILGAFEREDRPIGEVEGKEGKWLCDQVVVTDGTTGDRYIFSCKFWIQIMPKIAKIEGHVCMLSHVEESHMNKVQSRLSMVRMEHDNTGFHPAWFLTSVEVINLGNNVNTVFSCNQWLDINRGDHQITRDLFSEA